MTPEMALALAEKAIMTAAQLAAPVLISTMTVGIAVNILQTVTSIRDMSMTFVPKVAAAMIVQAIALPWTIDTMNRYFAETYSIFATFAQ